MSIFILAKLSILLSEVKACQRNIAKEKEERSYGVSNYYDVTFIVMRLYF